MFGSELSLFHKYWANAVKIFYCNLYLEKISLGRLWYGLLPNLHHLSNWHSSVYKMYLVLIAQGWSHRLSNRTAAIFQRINRERKISWSEIYFLLLFRNFVAAFNSTFTFPMISLLLLSKTSNFLFKKYFKRMLSFELLR